MLLSYYSNPDTGPFLRLAVGHQSVPRESRQHSLHIVSQMRLFLGSSAAFMIESIRVTGDLPSLEALHVKT